MLGLPRSLPEPLSGCLSPPLLRRAIFAMLVLIPTHAANAQITVPPAAPAPPHNDENGAAPSESPDPFSVILTYGSDVNAVVSGGLDTGADYLGRIGIIGDADLEQLLAWRGATAHVSVHQIHGKGLSRHRIGNLLPASGIEAEPALRLFNLWIEQRIGNRATLRVGQFTAGQEFAISDTAGLFINGTFGWPSSFGSDLPSGGPNYPLAAPGIRFAFAPDPRTRLRLAVFAGDPAGPGDGDPERRDRHGFNGLRFAGKPFIIGEMQRSFGGERPALTFRAGGWLHLNRFDDVRIDESHQSLALAAPGAAPLRHRGNFGLYGIVDAVLWRGPSNSGRSLSGFLRASFSPRDRNLIDLYADGGLALTGPVPGRPADVVGIGFAIARISPAIRALARDNRSLAGTPGPLPDFEAVAELSYRLQLGSGLQLQPNVQFVVHPGARLPRSPGIGVATKDALILGLRTSVRF